MTRDADAVSFYFFDFDDNIMFLGTPIYVLNVETKEEHGVSTGEFASIHSLLGKPGEWEDFTMFDGSFREFRDIPEAELGPGDQQYFVRDVEAAVSSGGEDWKAPSWDLSVHACEKQRPVSIVTARGHSPETLKAGVRVLKEHGLIAREPNYHTVFPVGNDDVRRQQLDDPELLKTTPRLKKTAIIQTVEKALAQYGAEPDHSFGMSDDDPANVNLIISAMRDCKQKYRDKRFFVINTHYDRKRNVDQRVKLEVFPYDYSVTTSG